VGRDEVEKKSPLVMTREGQGILRIKKHETVCDLCGSLIALTKRELEESIRGYAVIVDGRVVQVIYNSYRKRF
jgi:hypothetical protein